MLLQPEIEGLGRATWMTFCARLPTACPLLALGKGKVGIYLTVCPCPSPPVGRARGKQAGRVAERELERRGQGQALFNCAFSCRNRSHSQRHRSHSAASQSSVLRCASKTTCRRNAGCCSWRSVIGRKATTSRGLVNEVRTLPCAVANPSVPAIEPSFHRSKHSRSWLLGRRWPLG